MAEIAFFGHSCEGVDVDSIIGAEFIAFPAFHMGWTFTAVYKDNTIGGFVYGVLFFTGFDAGRFVTVIADTGNKKFLDVGKMT
jgi:hypothetical protein